MSVAALWAWVIANEAAVATILLVVSEFLGAVPKFKANGLFSYIILQVQQNLKKRGGVDPTP